MTIYRVMIEVPDAAEDSRASKALAELEIDRVDPITGQGFAYTDVTYRDGWALVTAHVEARTPTTAASQAFSVLAGAVPAWNLGQAVIRVAPLSRAERLDATAEPRSPHSTGTSTRPG